LERLNKTYLRDWNQVISENYQKEKSSSSDSARVLFRWWTKLSFENERWYTGFQ